MGNSLVFRLDFQAVDCQEIWIKFLQKQSQKLMQKLYSCSYKIALSFNQTYLCSENVSKSLAYFVLNH